VSCSPTGEEGGGGQLPEWTQNGLISSPLYQSRYLSDDGRVFFQSTAALVPQDTNGLTDVYEYEPQGVGSCTSSSTTFSETSGGCVGLISSGTSSDESTFLDASENGDDVFFLTRQRLVSQDYDAAFDVYDAHVCSGAAPCVSQTALPPACTTTDSCRTAPSPQPALFGASGSGTFSGAGNIVPAAVKPVTKARSKPLTRAQKLAQALKTCRKSRQKRKRAACETRARKRYAAKPKAKKSRKGSK
jgi:hypothetical protein